MKQSFNLDIACNFNVGRSTDNQSIDGNGGSCSFQLIESIELFSGCVWFGLIVEQQAYKMHKSKLDFSFIRFHHTHKHIQSNKHTRAQSLRFGYLSLVPVIAVQYLLNCFRFVATFVSNFICSHAIRFCCWSSVSQYILICWKTTTEINFRDEFSFER